MANEGFSLQNILDEITNNVSQIRSVNQPAAASATRETEAVGAAMVSAATAQGAAGAAAVRERGTLQINLEDELQRVRQAQLPEEVALENARMVRESQAAVTQSMMEVQRMKSVGVFDNPIAYVLNTLQLPEAQTRMAQAQQTLDVVSSNAAKSAQMLSATGQAIKSTARTTNNAIVEADAQAQIAQGQRLAGQARLEAIRTNTQNLAYELSLGEKEVSYLLQGCQALQGEEMFNLQRQNALMQRTALQKAAKEKEGEDQFVLDQAKLIREQALLVGNKGMAAQFANVKNLPQLKMLMQQPAVKLMHQSAIDRMATADNRLVYGQDPVEAYEFFRNTGTRPSEQLAPVLEAVNAGAGAALSSPEMEKAKSPEARKALMINAAQAEVNRLPALAPAAVVAKWETSGAPMQEFPLFKVLAFKDNAAAQDTVEGFLGQTAAAIRTGKISPTAAAMDLNEFALRSNDLDNQQYNPNAVGLRGKTQLVVPGKEFMILVKDASGKMVSRPADFTSMEDATLWAAAQRVSPLRKILGAATDYTKDTMYRAVGLPDLTQFVDKGAK